MTPTPSGLVDACLPDDAGRLRHMLSLAFIPDEDRRVPAVFLGARDTEPLGRTFPNLMADLMGECLPRFVRQRGGRIIAAHRFSKHGEPPHAAQRMTDVGGRTGHILLEGDIFLWFPEERVMVSAEPYSPTQRTYTVCSSADSVAFYAEWEAFARKHNYLRGQAFFPDGALVNGPRKYSWHDILLPEDTKHTVRFHVEGFLGHRDRLKRLGFKARRGLILEGAPGTGKTLLGKVLAATLDASFIWVLPRHIERPDSFAAIMSVARFVAPTVLFFEDLDLFGQDRDLPTWMGLGELMNQLDGAADNEDIVTIATTNRLEVVEKALRSRPGRFDRIVHLEEMNEDCRRRLLGRLLASADVASDDLDALVSGTEGFTGAQVEEVANTLYMLAIQRENQTSQNTHSDSSRVRVDGELADQALDDVQRDREARMGFQIGR